MCTAFTYDNGNHYFGRNLDLEYCYQEAVTITPRNYPFQFRFEQRPRKQYAMIGMATVAEGYPLYYDATNEAGLSAAGLNFPGNAAYFPEMDGKKNIAPFELIPWVLSKCKTAKEAENLLLNTNITDVAFSSSYSLTPLHWLISDRDRSITVEQTKEGLRIYNNHLGVLTNNPPFNFHLCNLQNYANLKASEPFGNVFGMSPYSRGLGSFGLPGDLTSASRFVRAVFAKFNAVSDGSDANGISQFFHILSSVAQIEGSVKAEKGFVKTVYSSCCNTEKGIYYYTTYGNRQITGISMHQADLSGKELLVFPLVKGQQINMQN